MNSNELSQCERFKEIRQALGLKQGDFAKELAISQGHASDIENGRKAVSDRIIEILSLKYSIDENWLRHGIGEMFVPLTRNQIITDFAGDLIKEGDSFKTRLIEVLARHDEKEWEVLEKLAVELAKKNGQG